MIARIQPSGWTNVATFVLLAFGASWSVDLGLRAFGVPIILRAALSMFGPAAAAVLMRGPIAHEGFADSGFGSHLRDVGVAPYVVAYLAIPAALALSTASVLAIHLQSFDPANNLQWLYAQAVTHGHRTATHHTIPGLMIGLALASATVAIPVNMLFTFGEEFGWRGYLMPRMTLLVGRPGAIVLVGIVWALWHLPLIVLDGPKSSNAPLFTAVTTTLLFVALNWLFTTLRTQSSSVWPSAIAHAAFNAQAGVVFIALVPRGSPIGAPVGAIGIVTIAVVAAVASALFAAETRRKVPVPIRTA